MLASNPANSLAGLLHDARNMVSAIDLYCDLLAEPGVLSNSSRHYADELRLVAGASRRLLDKLSLLECRTGLEEATHLRFPNTIATPAAALPAISADDPITSTSNWVNADTERPSLPHPTRRINLLESQPVSNLADDLLSNQRLLTALVSPVASLNISVSGGNRPIAMTRDDLTRVLVNLTRNAAEAMPGGGHLQITLEEEMREPAPENARSREVGRLALTFTDNGPGIPESALESIFSPGFTTHLSIGSETDSGPESSPSPAPPAWPVQHRGLGLSIVRSLVAAAGGTVWASNLPATPSEHAPPNRRPCGGAVIRMEFPIFRTSLAP